MVIAIGAMAAVTTTGCSSSGGKSAGKSSVATSTESVATSKALQLAATDSGRVNSLTADLNVKSAGAGAGNLTGLVSLQLKPATVIEAAFNVAQPKAAAVQLDEILTGKSIYFKDPAFTKATGKPWVKADISDLSTKVGVSLGSLLQNLESSNPLDQAMLFTASKNAHKVGTAKIRGILTTEYAGTYDPAVALAALGPKQRKLMGPTLRSIGPNPVQFEVWIDAHHLVRRAENRNNVRGQIVTTTLDVTSVNKAVHIALPPAAQVAPLPRV